MSKLNSTCVHGELSEPAARTAAATSSARDGGDSRPLRARAAPIERAAGAGPCARAGRGCGLSPAAAQGIEARRPSEQVRHRRRVPRVVTPLARRLFARGPRALAPCLCALARRVFALPSIPKLLGGSCTAVFLGVHCFNRCCFDGSRALGGAAGYPRNVGDPRQAGQHRRR